MLFERQELCLGAGLATRIQESEPVGKGTHRVAEVVHVCSVEIGAAIEMA